MNTEQEFRIYCSDIKKNLDPQYDSKDKPLILEGVASTADLDLEGDYITPQCIESFKLQATNCNIHNNHNIGLDDVIGTVLEVLDSDSSTLRIKFSILPLFRKHIEECIDNGVKLGLSIGGTILDYDSTDDGLKIKNMMLHEISLTPLPANWNTMGTVTHSKNMDKVIEAKCLNGVCKQFINNITETDKTMDTEKRYYTKDEEAQFLSEDRVVELINEALNNYSTNGVTEEQVNEIIDNKLREFVEQAKALEAEEVAKAQAKEEEEEEEEKASKKAKKPSKKAEEEKEEEEEEEEEKIEKDKAMPPEELATIIATAIKEAQKSKESSVDIGEEIKSLKKELNEEITKAMTITKEEVEKSLFDGLKKQEPESQLDNNQLKKFLKTKSEKEHKDSSTLSVKDIAKTLARD